MTTLSTSMKSSQIEEMTWWLSLAKIQKHSLLLELRLILELVESLALSRPLIMASQLQ